MPEEKKYKTRYDPVWKEALEYAPMLFLKRFLAELAERVDETEEVRSLEEEFRQFSGDDEEGVRRVDRLLVFKSIAGDWLYVHIEVQCYFDEYFGRRVMSYRHRARGRYGKSVITIVVFGDANPRWCPKGHREGEFGSDDSCRWKPIKLLQVASECPDLENEDNPIGLFVAAHLATMATRKDMPKRKEAKLRLLSNLQRRQLDEADGRQWYKLIDWLMHLPKAMNREVHQQLLAQSTEDPMKYVSFAERLGRKEGRKEGRQEGALIGKIQLSQRMLRQEPTPLDQLENLTVEELSQRVKQLEEQLFPPGNGNGHSS